MFTSIKEEGWVQRWRSFSTPNWSDTAIIDDLGAGSLRVRTSEATLQKHDTIIWGR